MAFQEMILFFERIGVADVLLPFLLVFVIVYAVLQKTKILGEDSKKFNIIIALVMGLAVVFPHVLGYYPPGKDVVNIINAALPNVSVIIIAILMFLILVGVFGANVKVAGTSFGGVIAVLSLLAIVYIFGTAAGWFGGGSFPNWLYFLNDPETMGTVIAILVFGLVIWFITKEPGSSNKEGAFKKLGKFLEEITKSH